MTGEESAATALTARPMRADAVRTRKALMKAAAEVFAEHGTEAPIAQIATRAGIAKGTVFRHFPTQDDLLAAIVCEAVEGLVAEGQRLVARHGDPDTAVLEFMSAGVNLYIRDRSFVGVLRAGMALRHPEIRAGAERLQATAETLAQRAQREGTLRADVTGQDVALLICGVYHTAAPLLDVEPLIWKRYLRLVFDGLRATDTPPLPQPPL